MAKNGRYLGVTTISQYIGLMSGMKQLLALISTMIFLHGFWYVLSSRNPKEDAPNFWARTPEFSNSQQRRIAPYPRANQGYSVEYR